MALEEKIHVGDIGTELRFNIKEFNKLPVDLSSTSGGTLLVKKPSDSSFEDLTLVEIEDEENGIVKHLVTEKDKLWEVAGEYEFKLRIEFSNGDKFTSSTVIISVED
jgi:hypothetical protein